MHFIEFKKKGNVFGYMLKLKSFLLNTLASKCMNSKTHWNLKLFVKKKHWKYNKVTIKCQPLM